MDLVKRILGVLGVVFGALGVLLAVLAIAAVWIVNKPVKDGARDLLQTADAALVTVDAVLVRTDEGLQEVRSFVSDTAEAIPGEELAARIDNLLGLVEAAATAADSANTVVGLTNKVSNLWRDDDPSAPETTLEKLSATLDDLATRLAEIDQRAKDMQERDVIGEIATQIDSEIAAVQDGVNNISGSVGEAKVTVADLQVAIPRWINTASIIFTLLFIWMGVAQAALAAYGWGWFRMPPADKEIEPVSVPVLVEEGQKPEAAEEETAPEPAGEKTEAEEVTLGEESAEEDSEATPEAEIWKEIQQKQDEAEKLIEARGRANYAAAAGKLKEAKALYDELEQDDEWEAYISDLKSRYSRLRALQEELTNSGL